MILVSFARLCVISCRFQSFYFATFDVIVATKMTAVHPTVNFTAVYSKITEVMKENPVFMAFNSTPGQKITRKFEEKKFIQVTL
jgi:hypothetical protein